MSRASHSASRDPGSEVLAVLPLLPLMAAAATAGGGGGGGGGGGFAWDAFAAGVGAGVGS